MSQSLWPLLITAASRHALLQSALCGLMGLGLFACLRSGSAISRVLASDAAQPGRFCHQYYTAKERRSPQVDARTIGAQARHLAEQRRGQVLPFAPRSLLTLVLGVDEPDRPLGRIGRRHEFAQGVEDLLQLIARVAAEGVVAHGQRLGLVFEFRQPLGQVTVRCGQFAQSHEGAHYTDRHLDSARATQDGGGHDGAVLGEGAGQILSMLAAPGACGV